MPTKTSEKDDPTNFLVMIANNKKIAFFFSNVPPMFATFISF